MATHYRKKANSFNSAYHDIRIVILTVVQWPLSKVSKTKQSTIYPTRIRGSEWESSWAHTIVHRTGTQGYYWPIM